MDYQKIMRAALKSASNKGFWAGFVGGLAGAATIEVAKDIINETSRQLPKGNQRVNMLGAYASSEMQIAQVRKLNQLKQTLENKIRELEGKKENLNRNQRIRKEDIIDAEYVEIKNGG